MRGNEVLLKEQLARFEGQFPIPMRGNEGNDDEDATQTGGTFPIPMRGNEMTSLALQAHSS